VWPNEVEEVKKQLAMHGWIYYRQANIMEAVGGHRGKTALSFKRRKQ